jgi:hypothetical protein
VETPVVLDTAVPVPDEDVVLDEEVVLDEVEAVEALIMLDDDEEAEFGLT